MPTLIEPFNDHGPPPYGYRQGAYPNLYKWEVIEEEQQTISRIRRMDADGLSLRKIAMQLEDLGIPGPKGNGWTHVHVRKILIRVRNENTRATVNTSVNDRAGNFSPEIMQATGHPTQEELANCDSCMADLDDDDTELDVEVRKISSPGEVDTGTPGDMTELELAGWTRADLVEIGYPDRDYNIDEIAPTIVNQGIIRYAEERGISSLEVCAVRDQVARDEQMGLQNLSRVFGIVKHWHQREEAANASDYYACIEWGVAVHGIGKTKEDAEADATHVLGEEWRDYCARNVKKLGWVNVELLPCTRKLYEEVRRYGGNVQGGDIAIWRTEDNKVDTMDGDAAGTAKPLTDADSPAINRSDWYAANNIYPRTTVELSPDKWTQCSDCERAFTLHPQAAGWHKTWGDEYECEKCWQDQFTHITNHYNTKSLELGLGYDKKLKYKAKFTAAQVKTKIKDLSGAKTAEEKLELKMFKDLEARMKKTTYGGSHTMGAEYLPIVQRLVGWKPLPKPEETVKL